MISIDTEIENVIKIDGKRIKTWNKRDDTLYVQIMNKT